MKGCRWIAAIAAATAGIAAGQVTYQWTDITPPGGQVDAVGTHSLDGSLLVRGAFPVAGSTTSVMYSNDHGRTWSAPSTAPARATSLFVHPGDPGVVFIGIPGALYRSDDFGQTWSKIFTPASGGTIQVFGADPLVAHGAFAIEMPPQTCGRIFGGFTCVYTDDWRILHTQDDGASWTTLSTLPGSRTVGGFRSVGYTSPIGPTPADPARLFVTTDLVILESRDRGSTWSRFEPALPTPLRSVVPDPLRSDVLYGQRLYFDFTNHTVTLRSDAGAWREIYTLFGSSAGPVIDPARSRTLWIGPEYVNGESFILHRSDDAGETWQTVPYLDLPFDTPDYGFHALVPAPAEPGTVYVVNGGHLHRGVPSSRPDPVIVEYQYEGDRYWSTSLDGEAVFMDHRQEPPANIRRTGQRWGAWTGQDKPVDAVGSCRFWPKPQSGLRTRVLVLQGAECEVLKHTADWILEAENEFYAVPPVNGACRAGLVAVHRVPNMKSDLNFRWATDPAIIAGMVSRGWVDEGPKFCGRPLGANE